MATNLEKYDNALTECLGVGKEQLEDYKYQDAGWDSVGHMALIAAIEEAFGVMLDTEDIIDFSSYKKGKEILKKYNVEL